MNKALLLTATLAACAPMTTPNDTRAGATASSIVGSWTLVELNSRQAEHGLMTIKFDGRIASGTIACNRFEAPYVVDAGIIKFGEAGLTALGCTGWSQKKQAVVAAGLFPQVQATIGQANGDLYFIRSHRMRLRRTN